MSAGSITPSAPSRARIVHAVFAGLAASLVGIGLARFAYTPLLTALIDANWFPETDAIYLGAANLAGYLAGALGGRWVAARSSPRAALRTMMLLASLAFIACAWPHSFLWYFAWRFAAGFAGGALMALAAPTIMPLVPTGRQGLAGGLIFTGVGLGIAASGTLVPLFLGYGVAETWIALGLISLVLTMAAWTGWPAEAVVAAPPSDAQPAAGPALPALYAAYGLVAAGLVPHMVFLVDFIARGLGEGLAGGAFYWVLFGIGAAGGAALAGRLADRFGFRLTLRVTLAVEVAAVALAALVQDAWALAISAVIVGAYVPGVVPLVLGRSRELAGPDIARQRRAWSLATTGFALGQAVAAYLFSWLFAGSGDYLLLYWLGAAAMAAALAVDLVFANRR